jgi:hypothetical protein
MVSIKNLRNILTYQAIISKKLLGQKNISFVSIANNDVQGLRSRIFIFDAYKNRYKPLHEYVPFYFATHTPMLYVQYTNRIQEEIVIIEVRRSILTAPRVIFTDGNASMQQLSKFGTEQVFIRPATKLNSSCYREYKPQNIPLGGNSNRSDFYSDISFLKQLDWNIINGRDFREPERKRIKQAEVLVPDRVPLENMEGISVSTMSMAERVNTLIKEYNLTHHLPQATYNPALFF